MDCIEVDWKKEESNLQFYEELLERNKDRDIAMLILPKIEKPRESLPSHLEHVQPLAHVYLLVRYFNQKLTERSYKSAMIFPSSEDYHDISR